MKIKYLILVLVIGIILSNCSGGGDDSGEIPTKEVHPEESVLLFPENNKECTEGVTIDDRRSQIEFKWETSKNTDQYEIVVTNLNTQESVKYDTTEPKKSVILDKAVSYSWYVISKSYESEKEATSLTWRFYNAGDSEISHPPYPAGDPTPKLGAVLESSDIVSLSWVGGDVDDDLIKYEVWIGEKENSLEKRTVFSADQSSYDMEVEKGKVYYWRIVSIDSEGNKSFSIIFDFKIK